MPRKKRPAYEVLGVEATTPPERVKKQYRALARLHHPDRNAGNLEAEEKFKEVQEAYDEITGKANANGDPEQGAVLQILSDAIYAITVQVDEQGSSVEQCDIVDLMKKGILHAKAEHNKIITRTTKLLKQLHKHKGRFLPKSGAEDILSILTESRIAIAEQQIRVSQVIINRIEKALAILALYDYRVEKVSQLVSAYRLASSASVTNRW